MPFHYVSNILNKFQTMTPIPDVAIVNGEVISDGTIIAFENGRVRVSISGGYQAGVARIYDGTTRTGNALGTVRCDVEMWRPGDLYEVIQAPILDVNCQVGDILDTSLDGLNLIAQAQNAVMVFRDHWKDDMVVVSFMHPQF